MITTTRTIIRALLACALIVAASASTQAGTIIKLNLGGTGPDVQLAGGILSTISDTVVGTTGDQNTDLEYTDFLNGNPDINTNTASFSLSNLQLVGNANVFGTLVIQNFFGGQFNLYDPANVLLLQGPLTNSAVTGVIGPPGTGALFTTTLGAVTGGTLAPQILPGSVSLSMNLSNVNGGLGFGTVVGGGGAVLAPFSADGSASISASQIPEPTTFVLVGLSSLMALAMGRRR